MRTAAEDVARLPKWAQSRLEKLEADVEYWKRQAHSATSTDPGATDVHLVTWDPEVKDPGLPLGSTIEFTVAGKRIRCGIKQYIRCGIKQYGGIPVLEVNALDGTLVIEPWASNQALLGVK